MSEAAPGALTTDPRAAMATVGRVRVLHVMAAEAEYGEELRARISPLLTGVGPVEAGVVVADALARLAATDAAPEVVITLGSAGSAVHPRGSVHQVASVSWRDIDASVLGIPAGETPFLDLAAEQPIPWQVPDVSSTRLSTGADVVSGNAYERIDAELVDMETWGVLRACQRADVALIGLRGVSDGDAELEGVGDWRDHLAGVDVVLAQTLDRVHAAIAAGLVAEHRWTPPRP